MSAATIKEEYEAQISELRAKASQLEAELAALPVEVHGLATELFLKLKAFFTGMPT